jgi:hypothetical protein
MTDGRRPFRQISGNRQEFQAFLSELTEVIVQMVIRTALVEGKWGTSGSSTALRNDLNFGPKLP